MDQEKPNNVLTAEEIQSQPAVDFNVPLRIGARLLSPVHLNFNLIAAVGVKPTNFDPIVGEILNFAILPLLPDFTPYAEVPFIELWIKPFTDMARMNTKLKDEIEHPHINRIMYQKARTIGLDPSFAADLLVNWFEHLGLTKGKKIVPLCYNYSRFMPLMERWLGPATYDYIFDWRYRDVMVAAGVVNDLCYWRGEAYPYPKYDLGSIAVRSGATKTSSKYAIEIAQMTAQTYKGMMSVLR